MTSLADMIPTMSDSDIKTLRANAQRLAASGSPVQAASAAETLYRIDNELARREALPKVKKTRAPAKKKVVAVTGHQTALPSKAG